MVEMEIRSAAASAINEYIDGRIGSQMLDDVMWECRSSKDATSNAICSEMWFFYSDSEDHRNTGKWQITDKYEAIVRRWIRILSSDWEMAEPRAASLLARITRVLVGQAPAFRSNPFWPFSSETEWNRWLSDGKQSQCSVG
jgi:hypothetical protein